MLPEQDELARLDICRSGLDDGVFSLVVSTIKPEQGRKLLIGPECGEIEPLSMDLLEHVDIPFEIQFADAVIGHGELLRAGIVADVEIRTLNGHEDRAVGLHDSQREIQTPRLGGCLIARDDVAMTINKDGPACAVGEERLFECGAAAVSTTIGIAGVGPQIGEGLNRRRI